MVIYFDFIPGSLSFLNIEIITPSEIPHTSLSPPTPLSSSTFPNLTRQGPACNSRTTPRSRHLARFPPHTTSVTPTSTALRLIALCSLLRIDATQYTARHPTTTHNSHHPSTHRYFEQTCLDNLPLLVPSTLLSRHPTQTKSQTS